MTDHAYILTLPVVEPESCSVRIVECSGRHRRTDGERMKDWFSSNLPSATVGEFIKAYANEFPETVFDAIASTPVADRIASTRNNDSRWEQEYRNKRAECFAHIRRANQLEQRLRAIVDEISRDLGILNERTETEPVTSGNTVPSTAESNLDTFSGEVNSPAVLEYFNVKCMCEECARNGGSPATLEPTVFRIRKTDDNFYWTLGSMCDSFMCEDMFDGLKADGFEPDRWTANGAEYAYVAVYVPRTVFDTAAPDGYSKLVYDPTSDYIYDLDNDPERGDPIGIPPHLSTMLRQKYDEIRESVEDRSFLDRGLVFFARTYNRVPGM